MLDIGLAHRRKQWQCQCLRANPLRYRKVALAVSHSAVQGKQVHGWIVYSRGYTLFTEARLDGLTRGTQFGMINTHTEHVPAVPVPVDRQHQQRTLLQC